MKPILISGAGLSGLLLARSLHTNKIPFQLFERDASIAARAQGYRLRISTDGLTAVKEVLTEAEFERLKAGTAQTGAGGIHSVEAITGVQTDGTLMPKGASGNQASSGLKLGGDVLGISRGFLRQCLFEGEEDVVIWGKQATGYAQTPDGVTLSFADGSQSQEGSMLIAADGPNSAITRQLTDNKVRAYDTGARMIHGQSPSWAFKQLGEGVWSVMDDSRQDGSTVGLITNVRPGSLDEDTELGWVAVGSPGAFTAPGDNFSIVGKVAADLSRDLAQGWHEKVRPIFQHQNDAEAAFLKMSTANPEGIPEWTNNTRVTVMGDAVHCMTPAGGVGANTALRDAAFLGRLLRQAGGWRESITEEYENEMRVYASEAVKMSFETAAKQFKITELK
jgi:2-polyprenyl-6-methoxyphenol hydroxylase-like FAD-dependent oxidoreductase